MFSALAFATYICGVLVSGCTSIRYRFDNLEAHESARYEKQEVSKVMKKPAIGAEQELAILAALLKSVGRK